jgi:hypothetical protein
MDSQARHAFFGLINRRERWGLSARGSLSLFALCSLLFFGILFGSFPFLSVSEPIPSKTLVVEGWISKNAIRCAAGEIRRGSYDSVLTTGGPVTGSGSYSNDFNTTASVGYKRLVDAGISESLLQKVPSHVRDRDRTYSSAVALRKWFESNGGQPEAINIFTESVHARRTRLLFEKALGAKTRVGVIAAPPADYPVERWWRYSEGVKEVLTEGIAYIYVRLFFWPSGQ